MAGFAEIEVIGRLGKDPEIKDVAGKKLAKITIATSKKVKDQEVTTWYNAEFWEQKADLAERFLSKGSEVCVKGEPKLETWTDKEGNAKAAISIRVNTVVLIGGKSNGTQSNEAKQTPAPVQSSANDSQDLPF